ncbi:unnamed protein product [Brassica rapa subsp. trilocularis]
MNDLEKVYPGRQRFSWRRFYPPNTYGTTQSDTRRWTQCYIRRQQSVIWS